MPARKNTVAASTAPRARAHRKTTLTPALVKRWVNRFRREHENRFPHANSGEIAGTSESWRSVDSSMRKGGRGFGEAISLSQWLLREYPGQKLPRRRRPEVRLSNAQIKKWVTAYYRTHDNTYPTALSGTIDGTEETWGGLDFDMRRGARGLAPKTTLRRWIAQNLRGEEIVAGNLTPARIKRWVDAYRKTHGGQFPATLSGKIAGVDLTWQSLNLQMRGGRHNFGERISLIAWLNREYPEYAAATRRVKSEVVRPTFDEVREQAMAAAARALAAARARRGSGNSGTRGTGGRGGRGGPSSSRGGAAR